MSPNTFPSYFYFYFWWMLRKVFLMQILYGLGLRWESGGGRWWGGLEFVLVFLLSLKSALRRGGSLLIPPLILHGPCQKWLANMHACFSIAFTSGPDWCECCPWDPAQWFPRTHVHENELLHWYFLVFNNHMCQTLKKEVLIFWDSS